MTITQLTTFLTIVRTRNFTTAANELGYAQSTVTTQIKQLEEELGCLLFERLGKTIVMTEEGRKLERYAEKLLQLEREIRLEVPMQSEPSGTLKLGVSESFCYNVLPGILMEYKKKYPLVDIRIQFIRHDTFPDMLKSGDLDLVFTLNPLIEDDCLNTLYQRPESLGFYVNPSHPLAGKKVKEKDLDKVPLLLTSHNCSFRHMLLSDLENSGITPNIVLETDSKEVLKKFAVNGLGVAFMPDIVANEEVKNGNLIKLVWKGNDFPVYAQVMVHKDKSISKAIDGLVEQIAG